MSTVPMLPFLSTIVLEIPANATRQREEINLTEMEKHGLDPFSQLS